MIITERKEITIIEHSVVGVICNCCGEPVEQEKINSIQQLNFSFGYDSLFDNNNPWKAEMCENCLIKFIKTFKIVPENFMIDKSYISKYDNNHDLHQKAFIVWKETNEWDYGEEDPYNNFYDEDFLEYEEVSDALEVRKPLHINVAKLATIHKIGLVKSWCENND